MVTLLFLLGFSEIKSTGQDLLNEIMVHFRAHWVVSMPLIDSGLGCSVKHTVNSRKALLKILFTEKHLDFLRKLM